MSGNAAELRRMAARFDGADHLQMIEDWLALTALLLTRTEEGMAEALIESIRSFPIAAAKKATA